MYVCIGYIQISVGLLWVLLYYQQSSIFYLPCLVCTIIEIKPYNLCLIFDYVISLMLITLLVCLFAIKSICFHTVNKILYLETVSLWYGTKLQDFFKNEMSKKYVQKV